MPELSRFYGIVIQMYYGDHPPPHFHARMGDLAAKVGIEQMEILEGHLPPRAMRLVLEWATLHQKELQNAWYRASRGLPPDKIDPLV